MIFVVQPLNSMVSVQLIIICIGQLLKNNYVKKRKWLKTNTINLKIVIEELSY